MGTSIRVHTIIIDANLVYEKVAEISQIDLSNIDKYEHLEHKQTDENLMKQFAYWHNNERNNTLSCAEVQE